MSFCVGGGGASGNLPSADFVTSAALVRSSWSLDSLDFVAGTGHYQLLKQLLTFGGSLARAFSQTWSCSEEDSACKMLFEDACKPKWKWVLRMSWSGLRCCRFCCCYSCCCSWSCYLYIHYCCCCPLNNRCFQSCSCKLSHRCELEISESNSPEALIVTTISDAIVLEPTTSYLLNTNESFWISCLECLGTFPRRMCSNTYLNLITRLAAWSHQL